MLQEPERVAIFRMALVRQQRSGAMSACPVNHCKHHFSIEEVLLPRHSYTGHAGELTTDVL